MADERKCGECGKILSGDSPGGLCPECLFKVGLQSQSQEPVVDDESSLPTESFGQDGDSGAADATIALTLAPGRQFGGYRIVRRLGSGGMGTVYEADQLETGRRVALKVLGHRFDSPEAKRRFLREGRMAASVNHPNSVYVFGTEEIAGVPVIAMELVPGGTLEERVVRGGPMPIGEAVDAVLQVIDGLEAAEAGGVLHRDVKAANCFVGSDGTVKVGDFGLSISTSLRDESNLTGDGTFLGTPAFSSPEQLRGDELDIRSDIYAVGVTLYYMLTGQMPFRADNMIRLIATVLEHPATSPEEIRPDIPKGLARVVLRCLQKQPAARFKKYDDLRQALAPFGSASLTPAAIGLRLGAGLIDHCLWAPVVGCVMVAWVGDFERLLDTEYFGSPSHNVLAPLLAILTVLYYTLSEGFWGASPGKMICGLRVVTPNRDPAGLPRALGRALVYVVFPQTPFLIGVGLYGIGVIETRPRWFVELLANSYFPMLALLFSTARRRNGYAGLHDLASGTRVVLKSVCRPRPVVAGDGELSEEIEGAPKVGPYHVLNSLGESDGCEVLLGYDRRLLRKVWIRKMPEGEPAVQSDLRDLGRPTRLRWLAGRHAPGECWDSYEAPSGSPLAGLLDEPQPWEAVRYWLVDLAEELAAGEQGKTQPDVLALDRVWITAEGRAKLLDFPAPGAGGQGTSAGLSPKAFLNQVAASALVGQAVDAEEAGVAKVDIPLPLHAKSALAELPTIEGPERVARRLKPLLAKTGSVGLGKRLGIVAACTGPLIFFAAFMGIGLSMSQKWFDDNPGVLRMQFCLVLLEQMEQKGNPDEDQKRRDLELYIAGRFGETISDADVWSNPYMAILSNQAQRELAERSLAKYPDLSDEEIAAAEARLGKFLEKLPNGLPGLSDGTVPSALVALAMAMIYMLHAMVAPSLVCALLFRGGLFMYFFGIASVTKNGNRVSRLRALWRSLVLWSPYVLLPMLVVVAATAGIGIAWSFWLSVAATAVLIAWSLSMPDRGIPDRLSGTYPVPR